MKQLGLFSFLFLLFFLNAVCLPPLPPSCKNIFLNGDIKEIQQLLTHEKDLVQRCDEKKNTLLHFACCAKQGGEKKDIVALLLDLDVNINAVNASGSTPLHIAASTNNISAVQLLLQKKSLQVNKKNYQELTPLLFALGHRFKKMLKLLLSHLNLDPNLGNYEGCTPLHFAAMWGYLEEAKLLLSDRRCDPHPKQRQGKYQGALPLHYAAMNAHPKLISFLLEQEGTDVNATLEKGSLAGFTPLHLVLMHFDTKKVFESIKILIAKGADLKLKSKEGKLPSDLTNVKVLLKYLQNPHPNYELRKKRKK